MFKCNMLIKDIMSQPSQEVLPGLEHVGSHVGGFVSRALRARASTERSGDLTGVVQGVQNQYWETFAQGELERRILAWNETRDMLGKTPISALRFSPQNEALMAQWRFETFDTVGGNDLRLLSTVTAFITETSRTLPPDFPSAYHYLLGNYGMGARKQLLDVERPRRNVLRGEIRPLKVPLELVHREFATLLAGNMSGFSMLVKGSLLGDEELSHVLYVDRVNAREVSRHMRPREFLHANAEDVLDSLPGVEPDTQGSYQNVTMEGIHAYFREEIAKYAARDRRKFKLLDEANAVLGQGRPLQNWNEPVKRMNK